MITNSRPRHDLLTALSMLALLLPILGCGTPSRMPQPMVMPAPPPPAPMMVSPPPLVLSSAAQPVLQEAEMPNTEEYGRIHENPFLAVLDNPLSTFAIDVDTASYANVRRFIQQGRLPVKDAVRIEELVNYFIYDYPQPTGNDPFSITTELSECPWNAEHELLLIGLQGREMAVKDLPPMNLVFLIDTSGSMNDEAKLPLLKRSFSLLVEKLRPEDRVAIVTYAGSAGLVLPPTAGNEKYVILGALDRLEAGGTTAGSAGLRLAYDVAEQAFTQKGTNRVILATDGDFNVGASSDSELERLVESKRASGIYLSVLGFGMGNYKDSKMQFLADKGNGNHAYIDSLSEARKVLVNQMGGTLVTIAKDVKVQVEFNPAVVARYRLIGYENRVMRAEDFKDDKKDAGELGAGHSVTALYEIVPSTGGGEIEKSTRYLKTAVKENAAASGELGIVKFRYKPPDSGESLLIEHAVHAQPAGLARTSQNFRFAAAVTAWGLILRNSEHKGTADLSLVSRLAKEAQGEDREGYRRDFLGLLEQTQSLLRLQTERMPLQ